MAAKKPKPAADGAEMEACFVSEHNERGAFEWDGIKYVPGEWVDVPAEKVATASMIPGVRLRKKEG